MNNAQNAYVVGGGLTGLVAAKRLRDQGYRVTVLESSGRLGGKIETDRSAVMGNHTLNLGAEFIDSEHTQTRELCRELGLILLPAHDQQKETFQSSSGWMTGEAFHSAYAPYAEMIIRDKQQTLVGDRWSARSIQLNGMNLAQYMQEISGLPQGQPLPEVLQIAMHAYAAEAGRRPDQISALQFVQEASPEKGTLLASDCGFRVEGGMEKVIEALHRDLVEHGVEFRLHTPVVKLEATPTGPRIWSAGTHAPIVADKLVLALPTPALARIEGLESLDLTAKEREVLQSTQYTAGAKFFVKLQDGVSPAQSCFFSPEGFQAWSSEPGLMTFLVGGELAEQKKGSALIEHCLQSYAKAQGYLPEKIFHLDPQAMVYRGSDARNPCYASPAPGHVIDLGGLWQAQERLAHQGVALAGSYLPVRGKNGVAVGFMECGINAALSAVERLHQTPTRTQPEGASFADRIQPQAAQPSSRWFS